MQSSQPADADKEVVILSFIINSIISEQINKGMKKKEKQFPLIFLTIDFYCTLRDAKASVDRFTRKYRPETNKTLPEVLVFCSSSLVWYNNVLIRDRSGGLSQR